MFKLHRHVNVMNHSWHMSDLITVCYINKETIAAGHVTEHKAKILIGPGGRTF